MDSHDRLEAIFSAALSVPVAERGGWVARECADDDALRARLLQLLGAHLAAGEFLATPVAPPVEACAGARIGRYRLLEPIGEGGLGLVFLAEQSEPFRRQVAVKVIKPGMDTREVIARFESERQALALMEHASIARVFDAGTTASGRPFFVMELVRGPSITKFCEAEALTLEARIELFIQVCHAIAHAHGKAIIHRDIKPPNILVVRGDAGPVPKVIDFGIAKATEFKLTEKTIVTAVAHFIGTPSYMSPEQAELGAGQIDARSDIYSLGVLLYELLAGCTPFDARELANSGLDEMRRRIREEEPPRPSARLRTLSAGEVVAIARSRQLEPAQLIGRLRRELDWIVLHCLEKDRARRYQSAKALADDLRRYLRHERVAAVAPSVFYALRKRVRRHRTAVLLGAAAVVTSAAVTTAWLRPAGEGRLSAPNAASAKTIAVLAFEDRSANVQERFADSISEELINALEHIPGLRLQARTSAFQLKGQKLSVPEIARRLGVAYVVEGSVTVSGERVTIAARLLNADGFGAGLSDRFECAVGEAYAKQIEIAGRIARALNLNPGVPARAAMMGNADVRRLVLEGRYFWNQRTPDGFRRAEESFGKALRIEPHNAAAHAGLASTCAIREQYRVLDGGPVTNDSARVRAEAQLAIGFDPSLAEPYLALGYLHFIEGKLTDAQRHFAKAATLSPNDPHMHMWFALFESTQGKLDRSLQRFEQASRDDPLWFINLELYSWELPFARRFEHALEINERAWAQRPEFIPLRGERARILLTLGRTDDAVEIAREILTDLERKPRWHADGVAIWVLRKAGLQAEAGTRADQLLARLPEDFYLRGVILGALGRFDEAQPFLKSLPVVLFRSLYWEDIWEAWRDTAQFKQLLTTLGCAEEYKVARATLARLAPEPASAKRAGAANPAVQRLLLEGRHYWSLRTEEGFDRAEATFRQAAELAPDLAEAQAGLATVHVLREQYRQFNGLNPSAGDPALARAAAQRAIRLDPAANEPYAALAYAHYLEGNLAAADRLFEQAIALNPNYPVVYGWHGMSLAAQGRLEDSLARMRRASELDPLWFIGLQVLSWDLSLARRYEEALQLNERAAALRPDVYIPNLALRGRIQLALGRAPAALELARSVRRQGNLRPRWSGDIDALWILRKVGSEAEATDCATDLLEQLPATSHLRGFVLTIMGRFEEGARYLEHVPVAFWRHLFWDEIFDSVRDSPRFQELLVKLGCEREYAVGRATLERLGTR